MSAVYQTAKCQNCESVLKLQSKVNEGSSIEFRCKCTNCGFTKQFNCSNDEEQEEQQVDEEGLLSETEIKQCLTKSFTIDYINNNRNVVKLAKSLNTKFKNRIIENEPDRKQPRIPTELVLEEVANFGLDKSIVGRVLGSIYLSCKRKQFTAGGKPHNAYICLEKRTSRTNKN